MGKALIWNKLVGQERQKQVLASAFARGSLGHAYLFTGDEGCGTLAAAIDLAMACLCDAGGDVPCLSCESCGKVIRCAHPDFNLIFPVAVQKEHRGSDGALNAKGWEMLAERARARVNDPYLPADDRTQAGIPVEWIREANQAVGRGALGDGMHVVIIAGIDLMNKESGNALLKTIEEPPPRTLMLLCTERPHDVLPTITSRCQVVRFGFLPDEAVIEALEQRLASRPADAGGRLTKDSLAALAGSARGSLGAALRMAETPLDEELAQASRLWSLIEKPDWLAVAPLVDELARGREFAFFERMFLCFISIIRTAFLRGVPGAQKYITTAGEPGGNRRLDAAAAGRLVGACEEALRSLRANGNHGLFLTNFLFSMTEILDGEEQQAG